MPQAFISYSRRDAAFVSQLQTNLQSTHLTTWRDTHNLHAGDRWPRKLGDAIAASPTFILIWSANAAPSDFVELEWTIAIALQRAICIVALDQTPLPATLSSTQTKLTTDPTAAAHWLLATPSPHSAPPPQPAVLQTLAATPDTASPQQIAHTLNITFIHQSASHIQGTVIQSAGPTTVYQTAPPSASAPAIRNNIPSRGKLPFVGRQNLIAQLDDLFENPRQESVAVLHGAPGVGKSELAREFARLRRQRYPGGTFAIDASSNAFALHLAAIGEKLLALPFPPDATIDDRGLRAFHSLIREPVLLIYDNVVSFPHAQPWLPYAGVPCHVLITTLLDIPTHTWPCLEVNPLSPAQSLQLVDEITAGKLDRPAAQSVAAHSGGLPVQILPHAAALAGERRRRSKQPHLPLATEAGNSFRTAYNQLDPPARLLLHAAAFFNPQHIPDNEITQHLLQALHWTEADVNHAFDSCFDLHLLQNPDEPRMHQLFAAFIRQTPCAPEDQATLSQVTSAQAKRFVELAGKVSANPADLNHLALLLDYPLTPEIWSEMAASFTIEDSRVAGEALYQVGRFDEAASWYTRAVAEAENSDNHESLGSSLHRLGYCHSSTGRFEEARLWYERAVAEKEKGDVHGRVDHESLGSTLHQVGYCYSRTGRFDEALPWYERAVAAAEKGDVHGRVDHASLGISLHNVGYCYSSTGRFDEARPWYERAVAENEKGDVHGRVDHDSLGSSLHNVGACYSRTGRFDEARPWYERAVAEKEKGDVHGRVDHASLGLSLHEVGYCYSSAGRFDEARPWFERAVAEAEKGDVHGRVDHASLGISLHQVGYCYSSTGRFDEARPWYERAVAEKEKGDVHGRVDHAELGRGLHQVGYCNSRTGRFVEARSWFERAVAEAEKGDIFGSVDKETVTTIIGSLANCLRKLGRTEDAAKWEQRNARAAGQS